MNSTVELYLQSQYNSLICNFVSNILNIPFEREKVDFEENSQTLLVGMEISTITVEYGVKSSLKPNSRTYI